MKRKKIIIPVVLVIGLCLLLFWKSGEFYGQKVSIPNPEAISQIQLRTVKISREDYPSKKLDNLLKSIEDTVLVESGKNKRLERNDEFTSVLLIYEDGTKEKFFFFENDGKWYMETEQGILYENAEFIKDYVVPQKAQESGMRRYQRVLPNVFTGKRLRKINNCLKQNPGKGYAGIFYSAASSPSMAFCRSSSCICFNKK